MFRKLPIGIENFAEMRTEDFYYVDKTGFIIDLLRSWGKVNLFTRPRRFGKTLTLSMLKTFFEIGTDRSLFDGLRVSREKELCDRYMGQYPVVSLSLKGVDGLSFQDACVRLTEVIREEFARFSFLKDDPGEDDPDRKRYMRLWNEEEKPQDLTASLKTLCALLEKHYGKKVILLIDEYDVPLDKAWQHGYYEKMTDLIRAMFGAALKTNDSLHFAVLTGCLRVSKESIFTGLNNFKVMGISDTSFDEYFGFREDETEELLRNHGFADRLPAVKEWYDGYRFGDRDIYCPWDVINYCDELLRNPGSTPKAYWINTSGNDLLRRLIDRCGNATVQMDTEKLIAGETITKELNEQLTYSDIDKSTDNIWSVLYMTGYLTHVGEIVDGVYTLRVPNREIRSIFQKKVLEWFREKASGMSDRLSRLYAAFEDGDAAEIADALNRQLLDTVSFYDAYESFYHGFLLALLATNDDWRVSSNRETGLGRCDISVCRKDRQTGFIVELKSVREEKELEGAARAALRQIQEKGYAEELRQEKVKNIRLYGIAFWKKECRVGME